MEPSSDAEGVVVVAVPETVPGPWSGTVRDRGLATAVDVVADDQQGRDVRVPSARLADPDTNRNESLRTGSAIGACRRGAVLLMPRTGVRVERDGTANQGAETLAVSDRSGLRALSNAPADV